MKKKTEDQSEENKQVEEWKTKYLRALADYQNLERRTRNEIEEVRKFAAEVVIEKLLPVVDTLTKAKNHLKDPGLDLAFKELTGTLIELGVEKMDVVGKPFNPHEMECVEVVKDDQEGIAIEEVRAGYKLRDKIIRVAQVKVGKSRNQTEQITEPNGT